MRWDVLLVLVDPEVAFVVLRDAFAAGLVDAG